MAPRKPLSLPLWLQRVICPFNSSVVSVCNDEQMYAVKEVYCRALGLVESKTTSVSQGNVTSPKNLSCCNKCNGAAPVWVDTDRVSLLLLRTGVPPGMLAILWEIVNCSRPGQLTRIECTALLALIALVQVGECLVSAEVLSNIAEPVVPVIDHPALIPFIQQFQHLSSKASATKVLDELIPINFSTTSISTSTSLAETHTEDDFDDFVSATVPANPEIDGSTSIPSVTSHFTGVSSVQPRVDNMCSLPKITLHHSVSQATTTLLPQSQLQNSTTVVMKTGTDANHHMNLPQLGKSPHVSPTLSFDNSQDEFDDFQSASSSFSGSTFPSSVSQCETSHSITGSSAHNDHSKTLQEEKTDWCKDWTSCIGNNHISAHINSDCISDAGKSAAREVLIQGANNKLGADKYAALREVNFSSNCLGQDLSIKPSVTSEEFDAFQAVTDAENSFSDFCSYRQSFTDTGLHDDFGDFETAFSTALSLNESNIKAAEVPNVNLTEDTNIDRLSTLTSFIPKDATLFCAKSTLNSEENSSKTDDVLTISSENVQKSTSSKISSNDKVISKGGPADWSDLFGILHEKKQHTRTVSNKLWPVLAPDEPPPLPSHTEQMNEPPLLPFGQDQSKDHPLLPFSEDESEQTCQPFTLKDMIQPPLLPFTDSPHLQLSCEVVPEPSLQMKQSTETLPRQTTQHFHCEDSRPTYSSSGPVVTMLPEPVSVTSDSVPTDKYSIIKQERNSGSEVEQCWKKCLKGCQKLLVPALTSLLPLTDGSVRPDRLVATQPLRNYMAGILEVLLVYARVRASSRTVPISEELQTCLSSVADLQDQLLSLIALFDRESSLGGTLRSAAAGLRDAAPAQCSLCSVCLTCIIDCTTDDEWRVSQSHRLKYGGHCYHPSCANLWLNCVDLTLPALSAAAMTLL